MSHYLTPGAITPAWPRCVFPARMRTTVVLSIVWRCADAKRYLVVATILTGMLYGLENFDEDDLPEPQQDEPVLPLFQQQAIEVFSRNQYLTDSLGEAFSQQWVCLQALRAGLV